jgi:hypothetical protein
MDKANESGNAADATGLEGEPGPSNPTGVVGEPGPSDTTGLEGGPGPSDSTGLEGASGPGDSSGLVGSGVSETPTNSTEEIDVTVVAVEGIITSSDDDGDPT